MRGIIVLSAAAGCQYAFPVSIDPPVECSTTLSIADNFDSPVFDPIWRAGGGPNTSVTVVDHAVVIGTGSGGSDGFLETTPFFDLRGSSFSVAVDASGDLTNGSFVSVDLMSAGFVCCTDPAALAGNAISFVLADGVLQAAQYTGGVFSSARNIEYDPIAHHFWQITQDGDTTTWSVSADGVAFSVLQRFQIANVDVVRPRFYVFQSTQGTQLGGVFSRLNGGAPAEPVCSATQLRDSFDRGVDHDVWAEVTEVGCQLDVVDGRLAAKDLNVSAVYDCSLTSSRLYDLHDRGFTFEIASMSSPGLFVYAGFRLPRNDLFEEVYFVVIDGKLRATGTKNQTFYREVLFDPDQHRAFRIRATSDDQVIWETSSNGRDFEFFAQTGDYTGLDRVRFSLGVFGETGPVGVVSFDNVEGGRL